MNSTINMINDRLWEETKVRVNLARSDSLKNYTASICDLKSAKRLVLGSGRVVKLKKVLKRGACIEGERAMDMNS